jgi:dihydroflavonol-4-reductase
MTTTPDQLGSVLVTGATGIVGWHIVSALRERGHDVGVLARTPEAARAVLPEGVEVVAGDLSDSDSLARALAGRDTVFHAAGMPEQWVRDPQVFYRVNVKGTENLAKQALAASVSSFVYTSTIDILASQPGVPYDESKLAEGDLPTAYERSKQLADQAVVSALDRGLPARFVHPSALFGPSPTVLSGVNDTVGQLAGNNVPALPPGGVPLVFAPDLARGQILAATAPVGSRYILSDRYVTFVELAEAVGKLTGSRSPRQLPLWLARPVSVLSEAASRITHRPPMLPAGILFFVTSHHLPSAARAHAELGWTPTALEDALSITISDQRERATRKEGSRPS